MPIKGRIPKKEVQNPDPGGRGLAESMLGVASLFNDLKKVKEDIVSTLDTKVSQVDKAVEEVQKTVTESSEKVNSIVSEFENTAIGLIKDIQSIPHIQGLPGKDADTDAIVQTVLDRIPSEQELTKNILAKVPGLDEDALLKRFVSSLPKSKADLKIIQETFETDPMSVIEKIMSLPEGKFKLKTSNIEGLEQTLKSFHGQLGRGYLHGGGFSNIYSFGTLVSNGLTGLNFTGSGVTSVVKNAITGIITVTISGGGGGGNITSINADTTAAQLLVVGTAGSDFAIVDNGTGTHTFNLPTASASNRGALSSTDWTTFNNKGNGTVTTVSVVTANGISGSVANATTTPAITLTLGAISPTSVNGIVLSGSSTPTLAVTGTSSISGTNTGDQNLFSSIVVATQTTVTANSTTTALTLVAGANIAITTDNTAKSVTITGTASGGVATPYAETPSGTINSSNVTFTLAHTPANTDGVLVILDGVTQYNGIDYTVSGTTITFVSAPATGSSIFAYYNTFSGGGVVSVASADGSITVTNPTSTVDLAVVKSPKLTTGRTISISGDLTYTSPSFDGTGNVTAAGTLATVNSNVGTFGSATQSVQFTVNGKGLMTAAANVTITPAASSITGGAALTKTDDTNVTLTLGGTPTTALLVAASLTLGWTGTLSGARGGTGVANTGKTITVSGNTVIGSSTDTVTFATGGATSVTLPTSGTLATLAGSETLSNKTLTAPKFASGGFIADANGNELLIFTTTASAVNEITFANAATGSNPKFTASGGDSNVGIDFQGKGTGVYRFLGTSAQAAELRLYEDTDDGTNYTAFKVGTQAGDLTYTLPTAYPAVTGYVLSATTAGVMSWVAQSGGGGSPGGSDTQVQFNDSGSFGGDAQFTFNKTSGLTTITGATNDGSVLASFLPGSGSSFVKIMNNGTMTIDSDGSTGTNPLQIKFNGNTLWNFSFNGELQSSASAYINLAGGYAYLAGNQSPNTGGANIKAYGNVWLEPNALGSGAGSTVAVQGATGSIGMIVKGIASRTTQLLQLQNSASANMGSVGGAIFNDSTTTSTTSTNGTEDDLYSYTTVANTFALNNDAIEETEHIQFVSSATASRRVKKYFAGTLIFDSGALTLTLGGDFIITTLIIRESSTIVRCSVSVVTTSASSIPYATYTRITSLTLSGTNILKTTGIASGTGAASGDISDLLSKVITMPAA